MTAASPLWLWGVGLTLGFPLLAIVLGELIHRLRRRVLAVANTVSLVRNVLLPWWCRSFSWSTCSAWIRRRASSNPCRRSSGSA